MIAHVIQQQLKFIIIPNHKKMSQKINELIIHVKEYLNFGENQSQKSIKQIENKIDDKQLQIHDIFARNLKQVINHYIQYQDISSNQRKLENHCEQFSKRIEKAQNLSLYDQQMIQRGEKTMIALREKKKQLQSFRESVRHLKKAAISIQQQRYSNAIKHLNIYRDHEPEIDTPLKKTGKIFNQKIKGHLSKIVYSFWQLNRSKMLEIGTHCYNKVQLSTNEKTNIYQAFFGRNSAVRNSLIRKSSILDQSKLGGMSEAPLRFLKKIKDEQILQKIVLRINVEMNSLKQTRALCKEMKEDGIFQMIVTTQTNKLIKRICEESPCENQADFKKLLSYYIGFLLFKKQIDAFFCLNPESKLTFQMIYTFIGPQANSLSIRPDNVPMIVKLKKMLDIFHKVLEILDLDSKLTHSSPLLADLFKQYCNGNLDQYQRILIEQIKQDNLMGYKPESEYDQKTIQQILKLKPPKGDQTYNFTKFVMYMLQIFNQYYDRMIAFVKDTELNKSQLHDNLSALFERIVTVYADILIKQSQPLQIAQGQINLHYCQKIFMHFSEQLQTKHQYMRMTELSYKVKLEARIVDLRTRVREILEEKIVAMFSNYEQMATWMPDNPNVRENQFVQWTLAYIKSLVYELRRTDNPAHEQIAYSCFGFISQLYWEYFDQCKQFTLLTIYNIDLDLKFIYEYIKTYFYFYRQLPQKFTALTQFNSLLLTYPIQDITERQKRDILYSSLDMNRIIPILKKYNKAKNNGGGKIRELKKKDVENVVKKLEMEK